jgi:hypothetical protein
MASVSPITTSKRVHQDIIAEILKAWPKAKTSGFMRALKTLPDAEYIQDMFENDPDWVEWIKFTPDAWLIDPEKRHVVVFEAVHSHDVPERKFAKMADLSWALDEDYYVLVLVRWERFNRRAYDVQAASLCSEIEMARAGEPSQGWAVPDWQKYDAKYCDDFFKEDAA